MIRSARVAPPVVEPSASLGEKTIQCLLVEDHMELSLIRCGPPFAMSEVTISVNNLSKRYFVGHQSAKRERYTALREVVGREIGSFIRKAVDVARGRHIVPGDEVEEFWALRDVSFEVRQGEVLGIIGRNGAGKSTLLKILTRITEPTKGRVLLRGRVASLLEVGTGFHPELTGRENVFLNGAILGMTQREISKKFEEIVDFSETERFIEPDMQISRIRLSDKTVTPSPTARRAQARLVVRARNAIDTPVKHFSSGIFVRLAFAVAARLEPEILFVDEVLAVGDIAFQRKCITKMRNVASKDGRTILFVTHNLAALENLCQAALLLVGGRVAAQGQTSVVLQEYLRDVDRARTIPLGQRTDREGSGHIRFISASLEDAEGSKVPAFRCGAQATFHFIIENCTNRTVRNFHAAFVIADYRLGQRVAVLDTRLLGFEAAGIPPGRKSLRVVISKMPLIPGRYEIRIHSTIEAVVTDYVRNAIAFDVEPGDYYGTGQLPDFQWGGVFLLDHSFALDDPR